MKLMEGRGTDVQVRPSLPRVNLLPPEIGERARLRQMRFGAAGMVVAAALVVVALLMIAIGQASTEGKRRDAAESEHAALTGKVAKYSSVTAVYAQVDARKGLVRQATAGRITWSTYLTDISLTTPDGVWLIKTDVAGIAPLATGAAGPAPTGAAAAGAGATGVANVATISFEGNALTHDDVALWLESLTKIKGFVGSYVTDSSNVKIGTRTVVKFTGSVQVTQAALAPQLAG